MKKRDLDKTEQHKQSQTQHTLLALHREMLVPKCKMCLDKHNTKQTHKETHNVNDVVKTQKNNSTPKWQTMSRLMESLKFWTQQEVVHLASNIAAQTRHPPEPHEQNLTLGVPKPTPNSNAHSSPTFKNCEVATPPTGHVHKSTALKT